MLTTQNDASRPSEDNRALPTVLHTPSATGRGAADDNSEVLRTLIEHHTPRLWQQAFDLCGDSDQADDLVQATWMRAHLKQTSYQGKGTFAAWIGTILRNTYINQRRAQRRREQYEFDSYQDPSVQREPAVIAHADAPVDQEASVGEVLRAVLTLSPREREVFVLRAIAGQSVRETATRLGLAEGTIKATFSHAVARLRSRLDAPAGVV